MSSNNPQDLRIDALNVGTELLPRCSQSVFNDYIASSTSPVTTPQPQINTEIKARLLAFQQKRSTPICVLPSDAPSPVNSLTDSKPPCTNKPLPSLPHEDSLSRSISLGASSFSQAQQTIGVSRSASAASQRTDSGVKKQSLSQRRGMRLNMKSLNLAEVSSLNGQEEIPIPHISASLTPTRVPSISTTTPTPPPATDPPPVNVHSFRLNLNPVESLSVIALSVEEKPQLHGLFANYSKYVDVKLGLLNFAGKASLHSKGVDFSSGLSFRISLDELQFIEELGHGNYGSVLKVVHKPTGVLMAMKEVRLELDEQKFTQILMELEILHNCDSPYIVDFYGAFFVEGAVYMCMEYMDAGSLDNVYGNGLGIQDECSLAYIAECVIRGLKELKDTHNIIHRDIKPTNILVNTMGKVKLCDFGVLGNLVASLAKTNIGCQSYMAPERICGISPNDTTYLVQLDVWSLGLTLLEVAAGQYPYPGDTYGNIFSQLSAIVDGEPPRLDLAVYSKEAQAFVRLCLAKNPKLRPSYSALLSKPWLEKYRNIDPRLDALVSLRLKSLAENSQKLDTSITQDSPKVPRYRNAECSNLIVRNKVQAPALHRGGLDLRIRGLMPGRHI